jgi:Zn-dependent protease
LPPLGSPDKLQRVTHDLLTGIKLYLVFILSTTFHEAAHAWTAWKLGDDTAHRGGQVTLDPTPHIQRSPIGMVVVPILSYMLGGWMFGWASAPFNPQWAMNYPRRSGVMSLAGPAANLILVLMAALVIRMGVTFHYFDAPTSVTFGHVVDGHTSSGYFFASMLSIVFSLNLLLCAFNLLPLPPMDGSAALRLFADPSSAEKWMNFTHNRQFQFIGLVVAWKVFDIIFPPIQLGAINILYLGQSYYQP